MKATDGKVSAATFTRFCEAINAMQDVGLGVLVARKGVADFPVDEAPGHRRTGAFLHQALYFARTRVPIVVLTLDDVYRLAADKANLIVLLKGRVDALIDLGRATAASQPYVHVEAPAGICALFKDRTQERP